MFCVLLAQFFNFFFHSNLSNYTTTLKKIFPSAPVDPNKKKKTKLNSSYLPWRTFRSQKISNSSELEASLFKTQHVADYLFFTLLTRTEALTQLATNIVKTVKWLARIWKKKGGYHRLSCN